MASKPAFDPNNIPLVTVDGVDLKLVNGKEVTLVRDGVALSKPISELYDILKAQAEQEAAD